MELYNIGVLELIQDTNFIMNGFFEVAIFFKGFEIDFFDGYFLFGVIFEAFKYFSERALPETLVSVVTVLADGLNHCVFVFHSLFFKICFKFLLIACY